MRLHGYCQRCHKIRRVEANNANAMLAVMRRGIAVGICTECQDKEDQRRAAPRH